ncbi:MAG: tetratricopeptide repeat protein, partial [Sandaracinobacteroides sp.]
MHHLIVAASLALACAGAANAAGGGGGGSLPSSSAPSYDPAQDYALGVEALRTGDYKAADRAFRKVLGATPRDPSVLLLSGMSKSGLQDYKGALKPLEKSLKIDPDGISARREYAIALGKLGDPRAEAELATLKARAATCASACPQAAELQAAIGAVEAATAASPAATSALSPSARLAAAGAGD